MRSFARVFGALLIGLAVLPALADQPNLQSGASSGGSNGSSIDSVDIQTGRLLVTVPLPILSPQRGGHLNFGFSLVGNSVPWSVQTTRFNNRTTNKWNPGNRYFSSGITLGMDFSRGWDIAVGRTLTVAANQNSTTHAVRIESESESDRFLVTADGATHHMQDISSASDGSSWMTIDGSGYEVLLSNKNSFGIYTSGTVIARNGNRYTFVLIADSTIDPCGPPPDNNLNTTQVCPNTSATSQVEDVNGNLYTLMPSGGGPGEDTKGNTPPSQVNATAASCPSTVTWGSGAGNAFATATPIGYLGYQGSTQAITECFYHYSQSTNFAQSGITEYSGGATLLGEAIMPDGLTYKFDYDSYGNLTYVGLPQGGSISYTWHTNNFALGNCGNAAQYSRGVQTRTLNDNNGHTYQWTYSYNALNSSTGTITNTVTDPNGNDTDTVFSQYSTSQGGSVSGATACSGLVQTSTRVYNGTGSTRTQLAQTDVQYQAAAMTADPTSSTDSAPFVGNVYATRITTTDSVSGLVKEVERTPDTGLGSGKPFFGQTVKEQIYDWGSGAPGALLKETDTAYNWKSYSCYGPSGTNVLDLPNQVTVKDGAGNEVSEIQYGYEGTLVASNVTTQKVQGASCDGNPLFVSYSLNPANSSFVTTNFKVYDTGMIQQVMDPNGNSTTSKYDSTGTYVIEVDFPNTTNNVIPGQPTVSHSIKSSQDFNTGLVTKSTDQNGQVTTYTYISQDNKPLSVSYPDGGETDYGYPPIDGNIDDDYTGVARKINSSSGNCNQSGNACAFATFNFDGLGRSAARAVFTGQGWVVVRSTLDAFGRATSTTNPYFSTNDATYGTTQVQYDSLGRVTSVTEPDNSVLTTTYSQTISGVDGICTTSTDEASKQREACEDALGRPTAVFEDPNGLNLETDYAYSTDTNHNNHTIVTITQKGRPNTSASQYRVHAAIYDMLGRLLSATNPETGTIGYTYDNNSNTLTKTDNRNIQATYTYDQLNRLLLISYNDNITQNAFYVYDSAANGETNVVGRLSASSTFGQRWTIWSYDTMGRATSFSQCPGNSNGLPVNCTASTATYDFIGDLLSLSSPTFTTNYTYDRAGWMLSAQDTNGNTYANKVTYEPNGSVASFAAPSFTAEGAVVSYNYSYNKRFQPTHVSIGSSGVSLLDKTYNYNAGADNGDVIAVTNSLASNRSVAYGYDTLNRLTCAQASVTTLGGNCAGTGAWGDAYSYDDWGNLLQKAANGNGESFSAINTNGVSTIGANNQMGSYTNQTGTRLTPTYDLAGNITNDGSNAYTFDAWNRITAAGNNTYVYGPSGERWSKTANSNSPTYFYGPTGQLLEDEINGWNNYIYLGGIRLAQVQYNGANPYSPSGWNIIHYYLADPLGTTDKLVNNNGIVLDDQDFFPFGGAVPNVGTVANPDPNRFKLTGQERDAESGLDFFGARFYNSTLGRWMSADWSDGPSEIPYANPAAPQSMNLYSYVGNNPTSARDLDGHLLDGDSGGGDDGFGFGVGSDASGIVSFVGDIGNGGASDAQVVNTGAANGGTSSDFVNTNLLNVAAYNLSAEGAAAEFPLPDASLVYNGSPGAASEAPVIAEGGANESVESFSEQGGFFVGFSGSLLGGVQSYGAKYIGSVGDLTRLGFLDAAGNSNRIPFAQVLGSNGFSPEMEDAFMNGGQGNFVKVTNPANARPGGWYEYELHVLKAAERPSIWSRLWSWASGPWFFAVGFEQQMKNAGINVSSPQRY